jgi:hypothetical protein
MAKQALPINFTGHDWVTLRVHVTSELEKYRAVLESSGKETYLYDQIRGRLAAYREILALQDAPTARNPQALD